LQKVIALLFTQSKNFNNDETQHADAPAAVVMKTTTVQSICEAVRQSTTFHQLLAI
jgi:hypothetical protein